MQDCLRAKRCKGANATGKGGFATGAPLPWRAGEIYQVELKGSGAAAGPAVRITTGLNPERISLSADGKRLAWSVFTQASNVWGWSE